MKHLLSTLGLDFDFDPAFAPPRGRRRGLGLLQLVAAFAMLAFLCACIGPSAQAQQYAPTTLTATNVIPATTTNSSVNADFSVLKHDLVALQVTFALTGSGTSACVFSVHESVDGTTYDDTAVGTLSVTAQGTTTSCGVLPISPGAVGYFRVKSITNPNANPMTNIVMKVVTKPKRQG